MMKKDIATEGLHLPQDILEDVDALYDVLTGENQESVTALAAEDEDTASEMKKTARLTGFAAGVFAVAAAGLFAASTAESKLAMPAWVVAGMTLLSGGTSVLNYRLSKSAAQQAATARRTIPLLPTAAAQEKEIKDHADAIHAKMLHVGVSDVWLDSLDPMENLTPERARAIHLVDIAMILRPR